MVRRSSRAASSQEEDVEEEVAYMKDEMQDDEESEERPGRGKGKGKAKKRPRQDYGGEEEARSSRGRRGSHRGGGESDDEGEGEEEEDQKPGRGRGGRLGGEEEEEADGEESFSFTQEAEEGWVASQTVSGMVKEKDKAKATKLTAEIREDLVSRACRFLLFKGSRQEPIKRTDLMNEVIKKGGGSAVHTNIILAMADQRLEDTFGFKLRDVPEPLAKKNKFPATLKDSFWLVNTIKNERNIKAINSNPTAPHRGLLLIVLTLVYCAKGKTLGDEALYRALHRVDPRVPDSAPEKGRKATSRRDLVEGLGDVSELLTLFVKQQYLFKREVEQNPGAAAFSNRKVYVYTWGPRAFLEIGRLQIRSFISRVTGLPLDPADESEDEGELVEEEDEDEEEE